MYLTFVAELLIAYMIPPALQKEVDTLREQTNKPFENEIMCGLLWRPHAIQNSTNENGKPAMAQC